jgi:hypothetical protein
VNPDLSLYPNREAIAAQTWQARSRSCIHRLLAGAGQAGLVAYREDPMLTLAALAHGLTSEGEIVVATAEGELSEHLAPGEARGMDARLSIEKEAPDPAIQIVASAAHALGRLEWLGAAETAELLVSGSLPERVAEVAVAPGGRLARYSTGRILLHDAAGVTPVMFDDVREQHGMAMWQAESGADLYEAPGGELLAMDILNGHPPCRLDSLFGRVLGGAVPGALLSRQAVRMGCEHMTAAVLCLDVDRTGLTLMKVSHDDATTAYVPFERPVASGAQLALELSALFDAGG